MSRGGVSKGRGPWIAVAAILALTALLGPAAAAAGDPSEAHFGWLSILPPLVAIAVALLLREVVVALLLGVTSGTLVLADGNPAVALARTIDQFVVPALANSDRASILVFSGLLGAMVGVISKSGGTQGIIERLRPYATSSRRGQLATWVMGVLVFFDDYANTLIVGSTMRPITDRLKISREKLAYVVDSTAAPIASLIPISTWIGFEIGLVQDAFDAIGREQGAFNAIVASIPYRFYQFFALVLGLTIALSRRDFGAMLRAERRAAATGAVVADGETPLADFDAATLAPPAGAPRRAVNAGLPILSVVTVTLLGLWITGSGEVERDASGSLLDFLRHVLSAADSYKALLWASLTGLLVASVLAVLQRILAVAQTARAGLDGLKAMLGAFVVLILAWSLGDVCAELGTTELLVQLTAGVLSPQLIPLLTFLLAAAIAFATGTSWGTMGIMTPLVIPLAHSLLIGAGLEPGAAGYRVVLLGTIASVLAGSVWGDHCSPISDTTILSSMASGCDHLAHVRTQIPYAVAAGGAAMLVGTLPSAYGTSPWLLLVVGSLALVGLVWWWGERVE